MDWSGTCKGITPCADCEGIETKIFLNKNLTFPIQTKYLGKKTLKYSKKKGSFTWDKSGRSISLLGLKGSPSQYKVGENKLLQLDMEAKSLLAHWQKNMY
ncbi:copper resistance protein NlpE [Flavobacterium limnophilum]|uniref:copper resistance protein NlpE n=1 Tax=Flavobacterium limnophilum TaxID=3003262 RepID=UPI002483009C|nr:copper resistance protein NlpE [Flavobacterium limnophilum]